MRDRSAPPNRCTTRADTGRTAAGRPAPARRGTSPRAPSPHARGSRPTFELKWAHRWAHGDPTLGARPRSSALRSRSVHSLSGSYTFLGPYHTPNPKMKIRSPYRYISSSLIEKRSFVFVGRRLMCSDNTSTSSCPIASFACMSRLPIAAGATVSRASASTNSL